MAKRKSKAPSHLREATQQWFLAVLDDFELESYHVKLLTLASEAWDRAEEAREAIQQHGITYIDRFGSPKARPEVAIERDARIAFARLLRDLALDVDAPSGGESRPPAITPNASRRR
ncbi:P27 family phage terminase small subunit [Bremerella sp. T1]|uniref:P27 family phage terminase small subunit n=1 Tax=Bremerella sp. TYQ1 TaxID=3119568 RepID=UPI001CD021E6|nr:P27 family phage terminase small subunit [Bremerella volcania]UBM37372.1 P27 family phage terminase small subunit [Bremerella volcania]